jgi:ABC-type polysaccharide/polyol phosphate export permease
MALAGLLMVLVNLTWITMLTSIAAARFRDIPQIVSALLQLAMFMTPVFWRPEQIHTRQFILTYNPFYYMLDLTRSPLLGGSVDNRSWLVLGVLAAIGWAVTLLTFSATRRRIVHYL